jgi:hypothetical protein
MRWALAVVGLAALIPAPGHACITGAKCVSVPNYESHAPYKVGEKLKSGSFNLLINATYHGLPASDGTFWYAKVDRYVFKITPDTYEVLDDVTHKARRIGR